MDLELLRTFLEVRRTRHFGRAAEALHLTQAAVSARIKHLESLLGVQLFERLRRDIRLTPEGNRLLSYAERLIAEWRKARQDVTIGGANQQLALGGSLRLWDVLLQDWLHRLHREKPDLAIIAESHTPEVLTRRLLDGVLDIAFMLEPAQLEILQIKRIALVSLIMVSTRAGINTDEALARDYLMVDWGLAHAIHHRRLFPDAPEPQIRVGQAKMALAYLLEIGGTAYLPMRMVMNELELGLLYIVQDAPTIDWHAYAIYPIRSNRIELIRQALKLFEYRVQFDAPRVG
jgi:DNA-binding transcriptional LysR family regulator